MTMKLASPKRKVKPARPKKRHWVESQGPCRWSLEVLAPYVPEGKRLLIRVAEDYIKVFEDDSVDDKPIAFEFDLSERA